MGYNELVSILRQLIFEILDQKRDYKHGLLGDGNGNVSVSGREDYVYVREDKNSSRLMQILNKRVNGVDGTPVLYGELPWQPGVVQVVSIDWEAYDRAGGGWGGGSFTGVPIHHRSHQYPAEGNVGEDAVLIFQPALQMLKTYPTGDMRVSVGKLRFHDGNVLAEYAGGEYDLSSYVPSSGYQRYVLVSLDISTQGITITTGDEVTSTAVHIPKPPIPSGVIPSAYVLLDGDSSAIDAADMIDARSFLLHNRQYIVNNNGIILFNNKQETIS